MEFTGKIAGDMECWCLEVTEEEHLRVLGEEAHQLEKEDRESYLWPFPCPWRLYPSDFFRELGVTKGKVRFRLEIIEEEPE